MPLRIPPNSIEFSANPTKERDAVLHQIHRALLTSPEPLPDTIFTLTILDQPHENSWSFSRSNDPNVKRNDWLMPHFSFWSWPLPFIGTIDEALGKIDRIEKEIPWAEKIDKVAWRGTAWFNSIGNTALRPHLLAATKGKDWADVATLEWETNSEDATNAIPISDFCKYKYIIYTEVRKFRLSWDWFDFVGHYILRAPPIPPGLRVHHTHSSTHLYDAHNPPNAPSVLFISTFLAFSKLQKWGRSKPKMAEFVWAIRGKYHICGTRLD
jgi:hypothetical protein